MPPEGAPAWRAHVVMLSTIVVWSAAFAWIKVALEEFTAFDLTLVRFLVASAPFAVVLAFVGVPRFTRAEWPRVVVVALLTVVGYHTALNFGETGITAGVAALIVATGPIWTAVISAIVLAERLNARQMTGIAIAVGGVLILVFGRDQALTVHYVGRALVAFTAPLMWATASVISKPFLKQTTPVQFTALTTIVGTVPLLFYAVGGTWERAVDASAWAWFAVGFLGILSTFLGNTGFFYALRALTPTQTMAYVYLNPMFALGWSFFLTGEAITIILIGGGALIILGVALTNWPARVRASVAPATTVVNGNDVRETHRK